MKRLFLALCLLPAPAMAEDALIYADCGAAGCTCRISVASAEDIATLTGIPTPPNAAQLTLVVRRDSVHWSAASRSDIDREAGGDGNCDIEVFDEIIPEDGIWSSTVEVTGISGCHPQVAAMVPSMVEGMSQTKSISWGGVFDPVQLATGGQSPVVQWTRIRSDYFVGTVPMEPNDVLDVSVNVTATLLAPDQAAATLTIRFDPVSAADGGALALIGMNGCEANAAYDFRRTGG